MYAALIASWLATASAQDGPPITTTPTIQVRPRVQSGYSAGLSKGLQHGNAVFTRARVGLGMERGTVSGRVVLQYVLDWVPGAGDAYPPEYFRTPPRLDLAEGWGRLEAKVPGGLSLDLTFGRMLFTLHQGRLISENDWLVGARSIDGLHVDLRLGSFHFQLLNFRDFSDADALLDPGSTLVTIGSQRSNPARGHTFDLLVLIETIDTSLRVTTGPYYTRQSGRFDLTAEAYIQFEDFEEADPPLPVESAAAGMVSLAAGWTFGPERLFRLGARYDMYSQPLEPALAEEAGGWVAPLGEVYALYGHMNLFQRPEDTRRLGLQDLALLARFNPKPRLSLELDLHYFWTVEYAWALGFEADGTVRLWFAPFASTRIGYSVFVGGPNLEEVTSFRAPYDTGYVEAEVQF